MEGKRLQEAVQKAVVEANLSEKLPELHQKLFEGGVLIRMSETKLEELKARGLIKDFGLPHRRVEGSEEIYIDRPLRFAATPEVLTVEQWELLQKLVWGVEEALKVCRDLYQGDPRRFHAYVGRATSLENTEPIPDSGYESAMPRGRWDIYWVRSKLGLKPKILDINLMGITPFLSAVALPIFVETIGSHIKLPNHILDWGTIDIDVAFEEWFRCFDQWARYFGKPRIYQPTIGQVVGEGSHSRPEHDLLMGLLQDHLRGKNAHVVIHETLERRGRMVWGEGEDGKMVPLDMVVRNIASRQEYHQPFPESEGERHGMEVLAEAQRDGLCCTLPAIGSLVLDSHGWSYVLRSEPFRKVFERKVGPDVYRLVRDALPVAGSVVGGYLVFEDGLLIHKEEVPEKELGQKWGFAKLNDSSGSRGVMQITSKTVSKVWDVPPHLGATLFERVEPPVEEIITLIEGGTSGVVKARRKDNIYVASGRLVGVGCARTEDMSYMIHGGEMTSQAPAVIVREK